ncbi:MAG: zinc ribbon domain-containing protein [Deltaproteobacteria bacterium]|nr:zinc ribbon domain-containing protein [Deltaproteobacteria bacterium]
MPIYEYRCNKCENAFEQLVFPSDNEDKFICPSCGGKDISRIASSFSCGSDSSPGSGLSSSACSPSASGFS